MKRVLTLRGDIGAFTSDYSHIDYFTNTQRIVIEGDFDFEVEDLDSYVQVRISHATGSGSYRWTYRDPSGELQVGDRVIVPFGYDNDERLATVTGLGRGDWHGDVKDVSARVSTEALV